MIPVSDRWKDSIGHVNRWLTKVEWTRDGTTWQESPVVACTVTEDSTSQVRWSADVTFLNAPVGRDGLSAYGGRFKVFVGLAAGGTVEWVQKGLYRIMSVDLTLGEKLVSVHGVSLEQQVMDARFLVPRTIPASSAQSMVETLIREVLPDAVIAWRVDGSRQIRTQTVLRDRWDLVDGDNTDVPSLAKALGAQIHPVNTGVWVVAPVPSLADGQVWSLDTGDGGALLSVAEKLSNERVYNCVVVNGGSTDEDAPTFGPAIAKDVDPLSETFVGRTTDRGGFGEKSIFYTSDKFTSELQCAVTARAMLAPRLGLRQELEFDQLYDPSKSAGDVGMLADTPSGPTKALIDSITLDTVACTMTAATRTTTARTSGQVVEVSDDTEEGTE